MARSPKPAEAPTELPPRLCQAVEKLIEEVRVIRIILDEIQDDFGWALDNGRFSVRHRNPVPPMHITSMAKDPLSPDWAKLLNRVRPEDLPSDVLHSSTLTERKQEELF